MCLALCLSLISSVACGTVASRLLALSARSLAIAVSPAHSMDSDTGAAAPVTMPGSAPTPGFQLLALLLRLVVLLPIHLGLLRLRLLLMRFLTLLPVFRLQLRLRPLLLILPTLLTLRLSRMLDV